MPSAGALVTIDGAHGEGGGALLRTALTMAALTQQPVRVNNVRGGTKYPGLDPEDLTLLRALVHACAAEVTGAEQGSGTLSFLPTRAPRGVPDRVETFRNEGKRGANAPVVLTSLLPVLARSGVYSTLLAEGETYGSHALSYDYFANVTLGALRRMGLYAYPSLEMAAFGREAAGEVGLDVEPSVLQGLQWTDRGRLIGVRAIVTTGGLPPQVGSRALSHLKSLAQNVNAPLEAEHQEVESSGPGAFVTVWAVYDRAMGGGAAMGARGVRIETLAQSAFEEALEWMASDATVDPFLADQILLPAVFAEGDTVFKVSHLTSRFLTAVWVVKQFTPIHITVRGGEGSRGPSPFSDSLGPHSSRAQPKKR